MMPVLKPGSHEFNPSGNCIENHPYITITTAGSVWGMLIALISAPPTQLFLSYSTLMSLTIGAFIGCSLSLTLAGTMLLLRNQIDKMLVNDESNMKQNLKPM